jgi:hypothetical protein
VISVASDNLIPIREVPKRLPPRPGGKRIHISAVYRWIQRGVRGVKLETVRVGGTSYTSTEALQAFAEGLSAVGDSRVVSNGTPTTNRQRQIERASAEVERLLHSHPRSGRSVDKEALA